MDVKRIHSPFYILLKQQQDSSIQFVETDNEMDAQVLLTNTCAIREKAESKIWERLKIESILLR